MNDMKIFSIGKIVSCRLASPLAYICNSTEYHVKIKIANIIQKYGGTILSKEYKKGTGFAPIPYIGFFFMICCFYPL